MIWVKTSWTVKRLCLFSYWLIFQTTVAIFVALYYIKCDF